MSDWHVGQEVYRYRDQFDRNPPRYKITRITKARIYIGKEDFWRHSGVKVGDVPSIGLCARIEAIHETHSAPD